MLSSLQSAYTECSWPRNIPACFIFIFASMLLPLVHPSLHITLAYWKISESEEELLQLYSPAPTDLEFIQRFNDEKRKHYLATRILCAQLFPGLLINKDEYGKPHFDRPGLHLSWAHSGKYAALISDKRQSTGIDIEILSDRIRKIEHKFCNDSDKALLSEANRSRELLLIWGAKEAMYKWYGKKEVDFKGHMSLQPFEILESGHFLGRFHKPGLDADFRLGYSFFDGHVSVWIEDRL